MYRYLCRKHNLPKKLLVVSILCGLIALIPSVSFSDEASSARAKLGEVSNDDVQEEKASFETQVNISGGGQISEVDYREVSRLASRMMFHLAEGAYQAASDDVPKAISEVKQARKLNTLIRSVLPTSMVETVIKDKSGKVVYRDERKEQDDLVPIFRRSIKVDVVQPLVDVWRDDAKLKGVSLADSELINLSLWVDLPYIELKLKRAENFLDKGKTEEAAAQLASARLDGVDVVSTANRSPLVDAIEALALAEEMGDKGYKEAALANLKRASIELELYKATRKGKADQSDIKDLLAKMKDLESKFEEPGWAEKIKATSRKMFSFFRTSSDEKKSGTSNQQKTS